MSLLILKAAKSLNKSLTASGVAVDTGIEIIVAANGLSSTSSFGLHVLLEYLGSKGASLIDQAR